jgi:N-acetylglucosamine kinase-like BadF-type ATPase
MTLCVGVDAGGSKTAVLLADGDACSPVNGAPGAVRPGRALVAASRIAAVVRRALTEAHLLEADILVVGAAESAGSLSAGSCARACAASGWPGASSSPATPISH